jgi:hypothetical protein
MNRLSYHIKRRGDWMAKKSKGTEKLGHYAFLAGILVAILVSFLNFTVLGVTWNIVVWIMVILGIIVGLLNITAKEVGVFLVATMALILAAASTSVELNIISEYIGRLLRSIIIFVAPAAIIVSLKAIYALAEKK